MYPMTAIRTAGGFRLVRASQAFEITDGEARALLVLLFERLCGLPPRFCETLKEEKRDGR